MEQGASRQRTLINSIETLTKSWTFTSRLPPDPKFPTPNDSHKASREELGPRLVRGALFTYVRPDELGLAKLLAVSESALRSLGLSSDIATTKEFQDLVAGKWFPREEPNGYPWASCYGGWQFGQFAGQLGDGRVISLFESTSTLDNTRYEWQLKGAGRTPYSRFADGLAVLRSSIREFLCSEYLNALGIPTTRALSLTLLKQKRAMRERIEPCAVVCRFAQSWIRIGMFDLLRARGDRINLRLLADFVYAELYRKDGLPLKKIHPLENRYATLFRHISIRNAETVAYWQAYGFMNGVLNTDNTSIYGLSLDFGPFSFMDSFDPNFTPNHDDHLLRYSYRNQPTIIWWNLVRLGESLGELIAAGPRVDDLDFIEKGLEGEEDAESAVKVAEEIIGQVGEEYKSTFLTKYSDLMRQRFGLQRLKTTADVGKDESDFNVLFSSCLELLEELELDLNHFLRQLGSIPMQNLENHEKMRVLAVKFLRRDRKHAEFSEEEAVNKICSWLGIYQKRVHEDGLNDEERGKRMNAMNPRFILKNWVLEEVIKAVEAGDEQILQDALELSLNPFQETWEVHTAERWCGDVPRRDIGMQCSCSS